MAVGVDVGKGVGVLVGTEVFVGTGVSVGMGMGVSVGGIGVSVGGTGVAVGGTGVGVSSAPTRQIARSSISIIMPAESQYMRSFPMGLLIQLKVFMSPPSAPSTETHPLNKSMQTPKSIVYA